MQDRATSRFERNATEYRIRNRRSYRRRFRKRHTRGKSDECLRCILYDEAAGDRVGIAHCSHDYPDLWRNDLGGEPRPQRGVLLQAAVSKGWLICCILLNLIILILRSVRFCIVGFVAPSEVRNPLRGSYPATASDPERAAFGRRNFRSSGVSDCILRAEKTGFGRPVLRRNNVARSRLSPPCRLSC